MATPAARSRISDDTGHDDASSDPPAASLADCPFPVILLDRERRPARLSPPASALLQGVDLESDVLAKILNADLPYAQAVLDLPGPIGNLVTVEAWLTDHGGAPAIYLRDLSGGLALRDTLAESRQRYKDLVEISSSFAWETGPDGCFTFVSPAGALGHAAASLVGQNPAALMPEAPEGRACLPFETDRPLTDFELWMTGASGETACLVAAAIPLLDPDGTRRGARGVCRDITEMRVREAELAAFHDRERRMAYILGAVNEITDPDETLNAAAHAAARCFGAAACRLYRGGETLEMVGEYGVAATEPPLVVGDGTVRLESAGEGTWLHAETRHEGSVNGAIRLWRPADVEPWCDADVAFISDVRNHMAVVMEQAAQRKELHRLSVTDPLTGLENRRSFFDAIGARLKSSHGGARQSDLRPAALLYIDLDNFKQVNDRAGHKAGDDVLLRVAEILRHGIREGDRVARLGGDEFSLWLDGADTRGAAAKARVLLREAVALRELSGSLDAPLGLSIGGAIYDATRDETIDELVALADAAMYTAKRAGKGGFVIHGGESGAAPETSPGTSPEPVIPGDLADSA